MTVMGSACLIRSLILFVIAASFASIALASHHHHHKHSRKAVKPTASTADYDDSDEAPANPPVRKCPHKKPDTNKKKQKLSTPEECARPCYENEEPKTCYYHFTVEYYSTLSAACDLCRTNTTTRLTEECQCIMADGYEMSGIITANRMYPGPSIMVCLNDYVIIDVANHVPGNGITIHWHGIFQKGYQYYDGVPYLTQCPIPEGTTFRYQWRALNSGTHFWHAHAGLHKADGLEGALIIREPDTIEPNSDLWDFDNNENVIFLTDWLHDSAEDHFPGTRVRNSGQLPANLLINGMGRWTDPDTGNTTTTPLSTLTVKKGYRYRFRMINSCSLACPVSLSIEGHNLTVIASDGENIEPAVVNSIVSSSAERYDFTINTDKAAGNYWIQVRGLGQCAQENLQQLAILRYESAPTMLAEVEQPTYEGGVKTGVALNQLNVQCNGVDSPPDTVCISNLRNARKVDKKILKKVPDVKLYLPINFYHPTPEVIFKSGTYRKFLIVGDNASVGMVANISNVFPPSPLLTQRDDIPETQICSSKNVPARCIDTHPCECSHVVELPLHSLVEIILVDEAQIEGLSHPFHLHGHSFNVIGEGCGSEYNITSMNVHKVKNLDKRGKMERHLTRPPAKDTYAVPNNGFTIIRFIANNPGYWLFHCHFLYHLMSGMSVIFHVGETSDLPPIPKGFPQCGHFLPPINE